MAESLAVKYQQIAEAMQDINSVVTRIDERVDIFIDKLNGLEIKLDHHIETCPMKCNFPELTSRLSVLESKNGHQIKQELKEEIQYLRSVTDEMKTEINEIKLTTKDVHHLSTSAANKWKTVGIIALNTLAPLVYILIGAIILKYFHLQAPSVP